MISVGVQLSVGGAAVREIVDAAVAYDAAGFESVWVGDHFIDYYDPSRAVPECFTVLALIANATHRIRFGSLAASVLARHPSVLAHVAGTLAEASGGRFDLALGTGGVKSEHRALGLAFPPRPERVRRLAESLQVLRALRDGGPVTTEIGDLELTDAWCRPSFASTRLIVASLGKQTARVAGRFADEVNVIDYAADFDAETIIAAARQEAHSKDREIAVSVLIPAPEERKIGGGPHPRAGVDRAQALGADRVIYRVLPPYPTPKELLRVRVSRSFEQDTDDPVIPWRFLRGC